MNNDTPKLPPNTEIIIPTSQEVRDLGVHLEQKSDAERVVAPDEAYYRNALGSTGTDIYKILAARAEHINECLKNKDLRDFMKRFYRFVEAKAKEMGYAYEDVEFSPDSGITTTGRILLKIVPKPEAVKRV